MVILVFLSFPILLNSKQVPFLLLFKPKQAFVQNRTYSTFTGFVFLDLKIYLEFTQMPFTSTSCPDRSTNLYFSFLPHTASWISCKHVRFFIIKHIKHTLIKELL